MKRNYKDDFDFIMRLYSAMVDSSGRELGWPDYDWVATFYTSSKANAYVASCIGGECVNCYNDNGQIHIVVDSHHMGPGRLKVEFRAELPRDIYPDGYQRNVIPEPLDIELVVGKGDLPSEMEVELLLPYIKGDAFTYADFTPEQIADLKRPATEAAERLDSFVQTASEAEAIRVANEESRVREESARVSQEQSRVGAEETRVADETKRREAEAERAKAEEARKTAESKRATEFASWETELDGKAEKSELSNIVGVPTEDEIEDIEPTLVTEALRKVPQTLTPEEQAQVKVNLNISKMELFCDLFNAAAGDYGYARLTDGVFDCELNGLKLTYEEAVEVYMAGESQETTAARYRSNTKIRTVFPISLTRCSNTCNLEGMFQGCTNLEIVNIASVALGQISKLRYAFDSPKLHTIGVLRINDAFSSDTVGAFNCPNLVNLRMVIVGKIVRSITLNLGKSSKISLESFQYLVNNSSVQTNTFTLIVHPSVYSKLTDESNTEWHQVLLNAAEKNITFATA